MISIIKFRTLFILATFLYWLPVHAEDLQTVTLSFYSKPLTISYAADLLKPTLAKMEDKQMVLYFNQLKKTNYKALLDDLQHKKTQLGLNDWLYYDLMHQSVQLIFANKTKSEQTLLSWFLLSQAGFDTRLTYLDDQAFVYVYTQDEVFEVPMIEDNGRIFVNISSIHLGIKSQPALYLLNYAPNSNGKPFRFYLNQLPLLEQQISKKSLSFQYGKETIRLDLELDQNIVKLMETYPFISEREYLEVPLSNTVSNSLFPQLKNLIKDKSVQEAIELLVCFTRSSFEYKEDKEHFGKSKPMIADEVFHYRYSDCEDRSALFYCLVKELLNLPMIIVAFPDHLTIGVALPGFIGDSVQYDGRDYFICDPTGPANSTVIGEFPYGYEDAGFKIIGQYK